MSADSSDSDVYTLYWRRAVWSALDCSNSARSAIRSVDACSLGFNLRGCHETTAVLSFDAVLITDPGADKQTPGLVVCEALMSALSVFYAVRLHEPVAVDSYDATSHYLSFTLIVSAPIECVESAKQSRDHVFFWNLAWVAVFTVSAVVAAELAVFAVFDLWRNTVLITVLCAIHTLMLVVLYTRRSSNKRMTGRTNTCTIDTDAATKATTRSAVTAVGHVSAPNPWFDWSPPELSGMETSGDLAELRACIAQGRCWHPSPIYKD